MNVRAREMSLLPVVLAMACSGNTEKNRADFERMRRQQRYASYASSAFFPDRMAMRSPPAGTLSREELALGEAAATGKRNGVFVATTPIAVMPELLAVGAQQFGVYCAPCHGAAGAGDGRVGGNMTPPPPSLLRDSARALSPGQLFEIVSRGRRRMPDYAWALPPTERWAVVAYVQTIQAGAK